MLTTRGQRTSGIPSACPSPPSQVSFKSKPPDNIGVQVYTRESNVSNTHANKNRHKDTPTRAHLHTSTKAPSHPKAHTHKHTCTQRGPDLRALVRIKALPEWVMLLFACTVIWFANGRSRSASSSSAWFTLCPASCSHEAAMQVGDVFVAGPSSPPWSM